MIMNRRGILLGLASALAAPAIVHAGNLMPVKALPVEFTYDAQWIEVSLGYAITRQALDAALYGTGWAKTRVIADETRYYVPRSVPITS